jgi:benzoyl-CoA 2,3-dioxygenase component B
VDNPRILDAFNQRCPDWLTFFCFTTFTDRDGKYQLAALAESSFDPLARTCKFMLTEEAHHLMVGETGIKRILLRGVELAAQDPNGDARNQGGIDVATVQKFINFWFCYSLDLFGSEISSNASNFFASGIKGRYREGQLWDDHVALEGHYAFTTFKDGVRTTDEVPLRNAMNELLRDEYVKDCQRVLVRWNRALKEAGSDVEITLPSTRFFRRQGIYAGQHFDPEGNPISAARFEEMRDQWLPTEDDRDYVSSLMVGVHEPGKMAHWIAPPARGINKQTVDFEYVRRV